MSESFIHNRLYGGFPQIGGRGGVYLFRGVAIIRTIGYIRSILGPPIVGSYHMLRKRRRGGSESSRNSSSSSSTLDLTPSTPNPRVFLG